MKPAVRAKLRDLASAPPTIGWCGLVVAVSSSNLMLSTDSGMTIEKAAQVPRMLISGVY